MEMKKYKLYEVADYVSSKVSTSQLSLQDYVTTDNLLQNKCGRECAENLPPQSAKVTAYKPGDILVSNIRPYLKKIWYANSEGGNSADVLTIRAKEDFEKLYIYYTLFQDSFFDYVSKGVKGSKMPRGDKNHIMNFEILVPENLQVQKKIASTLSTLDQRIENLRAQNRVLEQTAKTIYDYTFLQCAGHQTTYNKTLNRNIPANWEVKKLGDLLTIKNGKDHKHLKDGPFAVYGSGGLMRKVDSFLYDGESVLIPRKGTLNNVMYVDEKFWTVDTMFYSVMNEPYYGKYVYYSVKDIDFMARNSGTGVPSMTSGYLNTISIALPDSQTLETFNNQVTPLFKKVQLNTKQIETLTTQRNTLLPLLMTGQIEV